MRGVLNDGATTKFWSDDELVGYVDQGQRQFIALTQEDSMETITLLTLTAAGTSLTIGSTAVPSNFFQFRMARIRHTSGGVFRTAQTVPLEKLYAMERSESVGAGTWDAPKVSIFAQQIHCQPTSIVSLSESIQFFYLMTTTALTTVTQTPQINDVHHGILAEWGLSQAFDKLGDSERSSRHRQNFYDYIGGFTGKWAGYSKESPAPERIASGDVS